MTTPAQRPDAAVRRDVRATLMPGFDGLVAPAWVLEALGDGLESVCIYGANVRDRAQLDALGAQLHTAARGPLIAIDEEGGEVTRLHYATGAPYPGAAILGRIDDVTYTAEIGRRVAADILRSGFALALAPDADVNADPRNPVIGTRSFGADPELAARHTAAWVRGLQSLGAAACPKHFPGHGDTSQDSHLMLPTVDADLARLRSRDFPPFKAAIDVGARSIMTSHILLPQVDPEHPATFSRTILQGLLRDELGFAGVIVSDALDMQGASAGTGIPEAAVRALRAGCDLLCLGTGTGAVGLRQIETHIMDAIATGCLSAARVAEAAQRVRALRAATAPAVAAARDLADEPAGHDAAELTRILRSFAGGEAAATWLQQHPSAGVLRVEAEANMAVGGVPWGPFAAAEHPAFAGEHAHRFATRSHRTVVAADDASAAPAEPGRAEARGAGTIVIGRDLHRSAAARAAIDELRAAEEPVLVVEMGWPAHPDAPHLGGYADLATFGSSALAGAALLELLEGSFA